MRIKRIFKTAICVLGAVVLTSCAYLPIDKLMKPPKLTEEQSELYSALERAVGISDLNLKYPKSGKNRAAFVSHDLDGDGEEEAIAFYQTENSDTVRINILDKEEGQWFSRSDTSGRGTDVDFVDFLELDGEGVNLVIGWEDKLEVLSHVSVFSYNNGSINEIFSEDYTNIVISDLNGDQKDDMVILLFGRSYANADAMLIGKYKDGVDVISQYHLIDNITSIDNVEVGKTKDGDTAIFIDETLEKRFYTTEVIGLNGLNICSFLDDYYKDFEKDENGNQSGIIREVKALSRDIDGDGIVEVPTVMPLPSAGNHGAKGENLYLTSYHEISYGELIKTNSYITNYDLGYSLKMPEKWLGKVTAVKHSETNELRILPLDPKDGEVADTVVPILTIKAVSQNDYRDKFDSHRFKLIGSKGIFEYYYALPDRNAVPENARSLMVTEEEIKNIFTLMS